MKIARKWIAAATVAAAVGAGTASVAVADQGGGRQVPKVCTEKARRPTEIATAKLIIEFNATDGDLGVHGAFDDDGWSALCVLDPNGRPIAAFDPQGKLDDLTMAGVFFESREPPLSEFTMEDLAAAFPEGEYTVRARSHDGTPLAGTARFTHDVPAPPTITAPALAPDAEQPGPPVPREGLAVRWNPVAETVDGRPVTISAYEVIVTKEHHDDPHGFSQPIYDVHVPPGVNALSVPAEFLEPGTVYEVEVLALEESGNQTISVGFFLTS